MSMSIVRILISGRLPIDKSAKIIPDLAIFSIGIKSKGAETIEDYSVGKYIQGLKLRARATGEFTSQNINLDATLKNAKGVLGTTV